MKTQITLALLLIISTFSACKKEKGTHVDIVGKWQVTKIETTVGSTAPVIYTGIPADYFEFRRNDENEMVVSYDSMNTIGQYFVLVNDGLKFSYNGKSYSGQVTTITETKLEFSGTEVGATSVTTVKYYLTR